MVGNEVGIDGEVLDKDVGANHDMVAGDVARDFDAGKGGRDVVFVGQVAEEIEWAHGGRGVDDIEVATEDERSRQRTDEICKALKDGDTLGVAHRIGPPEAMMVDDGEAAGELDDLDIEIIAWRCGENGMRIVGAVDKGRVRGSKRGLAEDEIAEFHGATGHVTTPVG